MYIGHLFLNEQIVVLIRHTVKKYIIRGFQQCITRNMAQHPWGRTIEIFDIESPTNECSYEEHVICGSVLQDDGVVRLRKVQVLIEGKEETAIAAFWVSCQALEAFGRGSCPDHRSKPSRK